MTNAISIGIQSSTTATRPGASGNAGTAGGFASLLDALQATIDKGAPALGLNGVVGLLNGNAGAAGDPQADALADLLAQLLGKLSGLVEGFDKDVPPDSADIEALGEMMAAIGALLDPQAPPKFGAEAMEGLQALAKSLGLEGGDARASVLDRLAQLATRYAGMVGESEPETAQKLADMGKQLDLLGARFEAARQPDTPSPLVLKHLADAETKPNAQAAIASAGPQDEPDAMLVPRRAIAAPEAKPDARPAQPAGTAPAQIVAAATQAAPQASAGTPKAADVPASFDELLPQGGQSTSTPPSAAAATKPGAAYMRPEPQLNLPHVAVEISRHVQAGINRFEIRLNPSELGRIDVRLELDQSGNVTARLAVERSETLDLLQRDQRALERALAQAGLDGEKTNLEFSLNQNGQGRDQDGEPARLAGAGSLTGPVEGETAPQSQPLLYRGYARVDAVNLWV